MITRRTASPRQGFETVAVVLAGGIGTRIGRSVPKQLLEIGGRSILEHAVAAFDDHPGVDDVLVLMAPGHVDFARDLLRNGSYRKIVDVVEGGVARTDTTRRALEWLGPGECHVVLHDAARPLVTKRTISDCLDALDRHDAVGVAVPSTDTIFEVGAENTIVAVPSRSRLWRAQTPQAFTLSVIRRAHELAARDPAFEPTDDCSLVVRYLPDVTVGVVRGDDRNIKVTAPGDLALAERLLQDEHPHGSA